MTATILRLADVRISDRHRTDLGDVAGLAKSITEVGLLHPIVVRPDGTLIAGERRLAACSLLGWSEIAATIIDLTSIARGERAENVCRKDFTPTEAVAIGRTLEPMEEKAAASRMAATQGNRQTGSEKFSEPEKGETLAKVAAAVGMSRPTYTKARAVVEAAEREPDAYAAIAEQMDATDNVHDAYKAMKRRGRELERAARMPAPAEANSYRLLTADIADVTIDPATIDLILTDPPYPREYLPLYKTLARRAAEWLKPGGSALVMVGQSYLPEVLALMVPHLRYHWTLAYLTPGATLQLWQRHVMTGWKPVLWFTNGEYAGEWMWDVTKSQRPDKEHHDWGQSESGIADLMERFSQPGELICDPFLGGGTTAVVASALGRRFLGIDLDPQAIATTRARLAEMA